MELFWPSFSCATTFHHASHPVELRLKSGSSTTLDRLCQEVTPPCSTSPFLFNGHWQTVWALKKSFDVPIYYKRRIFDADDPRFPGSFTVDFVVEPYEGSEPPLPPRTTLFTAAEFEEYGSLDTTPMLVTLHGLGGGSHELYLRHVLAPLISSEGGWAACVVNARGCARSNITTGMLYNARATWDIRQIVHWLRKKFPNRPLFAIGFSLGANILANFLGEEGEACLLKAAVIVSNPWNLDVASVALQRSWLGLNYSKAMTVNLKKIFERHIEQLSQNPRVNVERVRKVTYLHEFDRELQAATWGYSTEGAYYRDASSVDSLLAIRIPVLALNAEDDPIAAKEALPFQEFKQNPYAVLCSTTLGGHLGWFQTNGDRWFVKTSVNFLQEMARVVDRVEPDKTVTASGILVGPNSNGVKEPHFDPMRRKLDIEVLQ